MFTVRLLERSSFDGVVVTILPGASQQKAPAAKPQGPLLWLTTLVDYPGALAAGVVGENFAEAFPGLAF